MKRIQVWALVSLVLSLTVATTPASPVPAPSGLVGWWKGDGTTLDSVATNNGVNQNIGYTNGVVGQAFACDPENFPYGTYCGIDIPDQPAYALTNSLTIEGWIRPRGNSYAIFWRGDNRPGLDPYSLGSPGDGTIGLGISDASGNGASVGTLLPFNVWVHVAATLDGSSGALSFYTNGVLAAQTNTTIRPFGQLIAGDSPGIGIGNVNDGQNNFPFIGDIDEISLYSRALTATEIRGIYNAGSAGKTLQTPAPTPAGLVSWWPAEGNAIDVISGNNGILLNGTGYGAGEVGQAFYFPGTNQAVRVPASSSLNVGAGNGFTLEAWINPADVTQDYPLFEWNSLISWGVHFHIAPGQAFNVSPGPGELYANVVDTNGNWHQLSSSSGVVTSNIFQHVALTYDRGSGVAIIYCNGQIVGQQNLGSFTPLTTYDLYLGRRPGGVDIMSYTGLIDEASVYNRALSQTEIQAIYHAGSAGKYVTHSTPGITNNIPVIADFNPKAGTLGTMVTLSGTNFSAVAASNLVYFGAVRATVSSATPTSLTVTVPSGATYAPITVTVNGYVAAAQAPFLPTFAGNGAAISSSTFATGFHLPTTNGPYRVVIADLDGDGRPDLVVDEYYAGTVSIYQNLGTAGQLSASSFAAPIVFNVAGNSAPFGLTVADVNGDGKLDLLICDGNNNQIAVFQNLSTGGLLTTNSFAAPIYFAVGTRPIMVRVRDVDGDGYPDLITVNNASDNVSILRNLGAAGMITTNLFAPRVDLVTPGNGQSLAVGDLDGDGKPDLVVGDDSGFISIFQNQCTPGNIGFAGRVALPSQSGVADVEISDLDGDGKPELITTAYLPQNMSVYRNLSSPGILTTNSFAAPVDYALAGRGHTIAISDINGDGKPDLAEVTELNSSLSVFQNVGTGGFTNTSLAARVDFATGWNAWGVAVGDLDGDGRPDVVFANQYDNTITVYKNQMPLVVTPPVCTPAPSGLVAWWPGEGNANDIISGNNGSPVGALGYASGEVGQAFVFDGSTSYIPLPASSSLNIGATGSGITIEGWINPNYPEGGAMPIAEWDSAATDGLQLWAEGNHKLFANIIDTSGSSHEFFSANDLISTNRWQQVALTYDKSTGIAVLYLNGISVAATNFGSLTPQTTYPLNIGRRTGQPIGLNDTFNGQMDELSLYNRSLTSSEIAAIYNAGSAGKCLPTGPTNNCVPAPSGLVAWWPAEGNAADPFGGHNGVLQHGAGFAAGEVGQAFAFNGASNFVAIPKAPSLDVGNQVTIEFWIKADPTNAMNSYQGLVTSDFYGIEIANGFALGSLGVNFFISTDGGASVSPASYPDTATINNGGAVVSAGQWHHVAGTYDGTKLQLYIDGQPWGVPNYHTGAISPMLANSFVSLGAEDGRTICPFCVGNRYFNGLIDEPAIYNRALSAAEIQAIYNAGSAGKCPPPGPTNNCVPAPSGLVGWWPAEGNANDVVGGNIGIYQNSTYSGGEVGQAFAFDGSGSSYVRVPASSSVDVGQGNGFTIELWCNPTTTNNVTPLTLVEWNNNSGTFTGIGCHLEFYAGGRILGDVVDPNTGNDHYAESPGGNVLPNVWQHVAMTYDKLAGLLTLYQNGTMVASQNVGNWRPSTSADLYFGIRSSGIFAPIPFSGAMDEISLYNRALSAPEIQAIYSAGSLGKCFTPAAPSITVQPVSETNVVGTTATFSPTAGGTSPLCYQWSLNGTNIDGATNSVLILTNVQVSQAGNYALLVTNNYGSVISSNAVLTVVVPAVPPTILSQTPSQVVLLGNAATFNVAASGSDPLSYFWKRNGAIIPGATNSSYTLYNAQLSDSGGKFSCLVTNAYGSASSTNVSLKVIDTMANDLCSGAIVITNASYTIAQSTLKASAYGDPMPDCVAGFGHGVWYQFTAPVSGLLIVDTFGSDFDTGLALYTGSCDSLTEVACNDDTGGVTSQIVLPTAAGTTYYIIAGGYSSDAGNLVLHLNHLTPPSFVVQPTNQSVVVSSNVSFSATLAGTLPMSFQWYFNNAPLANGGRISGSTNSTLNIATILTNDAGSYELVASNQIGIATSSVAILTPIILPPVITLQPVDQSVLIGSNATFTAGVDGTPPYSFQWSFNGSPLTDDGLHVSGSATTSLTLSNLTTADAGSYTLNVTNIVGGTNTTAAVLTVLVPPSITLNPIGRSVPVGLPTTFNAAASGIPAPSYQWQLNGTNLPGATSLSYTVAAVGTNDLGFYHLVATNAVGGVISTAAQLTFGPVAAWGRNNSGESLPPPGLSNVVGVAGGIATGFAVKSDGTVVYWGSSNGTNVPASATNVIAVSATGVFGNNALRSDGTVVGWAGSLPPAVSNIVSVASGFNFSLALRAEGTVVGWGNQLFSTVPAGLNHVVALSAGFSHALALRSDGTVVAWGTGTATNVPVGLTNVTAIAAGYAHSLALKANGTVVAWGSGTGTNVPAGLTNIVAISAENAVPNSLSLALRVNGTVVAWGDSPNGETNLPSGLSNLLSVAVAAVPNHSLALVNDGSPQILQPPIGQTAYAGRNVALQATVVGAAPLSYQWLLNGTNLPGATSTSLVISKVQFSNAGSYQLLVSNSLSTALSLAAPLTVISNNTLTILSPDSASATNVYQGGKVTFYSGAVLGNGPLRYQWFFLPTNKNYTAVAGATNDTLVLDPALVAHTGNYYVAVSNQVSGITNTPIFLRVLFAKAWGYLATDPPMNVTNATAIAVGNLGQGSPSGHYLVLKSDGKLASWSGSFVQFGETNVAALSNSIVTAIAAGYADSLALKSDGTVYAWGYNNSGETNVPSGLNGVTAIACGDYHDLALKSDGTVAGWGQNTYSQTTNAAATNVVAIAAGGQSSIALRADGSIVTWGYGGQQIPFNATNVIAVACGGSSAGFLALRANGTVVNWGGQYTAPASWTNIVAISAGANHSVALRNDGTILTLGNYYNGPTTTAGSVPSDLANVVAIASGGDHDLGLFGTRAPAFTVQPWNRSIASTARTNIILAAKCAGVQPVFYQWQLNGTNLPSATNDTLVLTNNPSPQFGPVRFIPAGAYQLIASNAYGVVASKYAKVTMFIPLNVAMNATNLVWTTSGNASWFGETNITHDGVSAAQSGGIGALQETILQTTVGTNQAGSYTFWWKVSSEQDFDFLEFRINGIVQTSISGEVDWQQVSIPVTVGTNVLQWRYSKDASFDAGQDAGWVDQFAFVPAPPVITLQPVSQIVNLGNNVTFRVAAIGGTPDLRYQWRQNGNLIGGNSPLLTMSSVARAQNGTYTVTVTNVGGSTISSNALLKVLVPQLLGTPKLMPDGTFQLTSTDANGGLLSPSDLANFEAQASTNLVNWVSLPNALNLTNGALSLQDPAPTNYPARYYRILEH